MGLMDVEMTYEITGSSIQKCLWFLYYKAEAWYGPADIEQPRTVYFVMYTNISGILSNGSNVYRNDL